MYETYNLYQSSQIDSLRNKSMLFSCVSCGSNFIFYAENNLSAKDLRRKHFELFANEDETFHTFFAQFQSSKFKPQQLCGDKKSTENFSSILVFSK